jgi:hypothetical protein
MQPVRNGSQSAARPVREFIGTTTMAKPRNILILIADGEHARFVRPAEPL